MIKIFNPIKLKELQQILLQAHTYFNQGLKSVLATIVKIEGSGYRRQGTKMLISESGKFTGAISGGCVEKEVWLQSDSVFKTGITKLITYDGRYRLGCEGTLYILMELINIDNEKLTIFNKIYSLRSKLEMISLFTMKVDQDPNSGTYLIQDESYISLGKNNELLDKDFDHSKLNSLKEKLNPVRSLLIFGSEHDSVSLCNIASKVGWDVTIIAHPLNEKKISYFDGAANLIHLLPEEIDQLNFDEQTACILMSHSFSRDLAYLIHLADFNIPYIGLLGPHKRRDQLINQLIERKPEISNLFLDALYGPVGLDIGAETPQEIAIAILAELQSVFTKTEVDNLRNKSGSIHERKT